MNHSARFSFIFGGARSGKSTYAEKMAAAYHRVTYIATAQALDDEMTARIHKHRENRPAGWRTIEIPFGLGQSLLAAPPDTELILVDCLTLLISNLLMQIATPDYEVDEDIAAKNVSQEISSLTQAITQIPVNWIIVSNEVGMGLVPPYPLGRVYRDLLGWANQRLAAQADQVIFMLAGLPMRLTPMS